MFTLGGAPQDLFISKQLTGTHGQMGTYQLSQSIASPTLPQQANPGTISGDFEVERSTLQPVIAPGTTVSSCSPVVGTQCTVNGNLTLSSAPTLSKPAHSILLPGPNSASGDQHYTVTTSLTGQTLAALTASVSNSTLTVTAGPGGLKRGMAVIGVNGSNVSTTTTGSLVVGQYVVPVTSCTGFNNGAFIVGLSGSTQLFPPGTQIATCIGTTLTTSAAGPYFTLPTTQDTTTVSGSPVITFPINGQSPFAYWKGEPINSLAGAFPANTTIVSWQIDVGNSRLVNVTLSANATVSGPDTITVGGAIHTAASGATIWALNGWDQITDFGTGSGGNGTYSILYGAGASSTTMFAYDTPWTVYVTGGPRSIQPQQLIWSDAFPYGTTALEVFGNSPSAQTIITNQTGNAFYSVSATVAHTSGSGSMWVLPDGLYRGTRGNTYGNLISGFPGVGLNMSCGGGTFPQTGCGLSVDSNNFYLKNGIGRLVAGDNSGGSSSTYNEYDINWVADIIEGGTVGSYYVGEQMQGEDESSNSQVFAQDCISDNFTSVSGSYTSGAGYEGSCLGAQGMVSVQAIPSGFGLPWFGSIYQPPYDAMFTGQQLPFPQAIYGSTNTGGIPYFTSTQLASSATLGAGNVVIGGGPGTAPYAAPTANGVVNAFANDTGTIGGLLVGGGDLIGGALTSGSASNTDLTGRVTLSSGAFTYNFSTYFTSQPNCFTADVTTPTNNSYAVEIAGAGYIGTGTASETFVSNSAAAAFPGGSGYPTQGWGNNGTIPVQLEYDFGLGNTQILTGYTLFRSSTQPGGGGGWNSASTSPAAWTFQGSNDNSAWTTLDTRSAQTITVNAAPASYSFSNSTAYRYYRINISAVAAGSYANITVMTLTGSGMALPSVGFHGTSSDVIKYHCIGGTTT